MADVSSALKRQLNQGQVEAKTLTEMLSVDLATLLGSVEPDIDTTGLRHGEGGILVRMRLAGKRLHQHGGAQAFAKYSTHRSDMVRGMAAFALEADSQLSLPQRLLRIRPLADDSNMGVREWAWMATRPFFVDRLPEAIERLTPWTADASPNIRRFATESTRPRGVWCLHLEALKTKPQLALPLLEPLHSDGAKYVQDSVSNWLNDAAKSQPDWVRELCAKWSKKSHSPATARIVKRALRSL